MPLTSLLKNNREWSDKIRKSHPEFFQTLSKQQAPEYLWIGCSDSRVPANEICGLAPGEIFVHRNVANLVVHSDLNCLAVIQYAVEVLRVAHIIVVGHYGCGGVKAACCGHRLGLIDNWLAHVQDVKEKHVKHLDTFPDDSERVNRLCELNVIQQTVNAASTTIVQAAWGRGQQISVHGWVYSLEDGLIRPIGVTISNKEDLDKASVHDWELNKVAEPLQFNEVEDVMTPPKLEAS